MDETTQLLSVTVEGMKFTFEATKEAIEMMLKLLMALKSEAIKTGRLGLKAGKGIATIPGAFKYFKNSGKTNKANFQLKSGGAGIGYVLGMDEYKALKKYAKKSGLLFYKMAKFKSDEKVHIMVPKDSVENFKSALEMVYAKRRKSIIKDIKKEYKAGEKDLILEELERRMNEAKEKGSKEESVEDYLKSQGMDKMSPEEVSEKCKEGMDEAQVKEFNGFTGEMGERLGEKIKDATAEHISEVMEAVKNNEFRNLVNRSNMVYVEIAQENILLDENNKEAVKVVNAGMDDSKSVSLPKENFLDLGNGSFLFVAHEDMAFVDGDTEYTAKDIKKTFNMKSESGGNTYSDKFKELFRTDAKDKRKEKALSTEEELKKYIEDVKNALKKKGESILLREDVSYIEIPEKDINMSKEPWMVTSETEGFKVALPKENFVKLRETDSYVFIANRGTEISIGEDRHTMEEMENKLGKGRVMFDKSGNEVQGQITHSKEFDSLFNRDSKAKEQKTKDFSKNTHVRK